MDPSSRDRGRELQRSQADRARPQPAHSVRRGTLSQHLRLLEPAHGDIHDHRRRLHTRVPVLRRHVRPPSELDLGAPVRVAESVAELGLRHAVITAVDRDDLRDGGSGIFARTIRAIRRRSPETTIEVLTPDFQGDLDAVRTVVEAGPDIFNHNTETVPRLYARIRPKAVYANSLALL